MQDLQQLKLPELAKLHTNDIVYLIYRENNDVVINDFAKLIKKSFSEYGFEVKSYTFVCNVLSYGKSWFVLSSDELKEDSQKAQENEPALVQIDRNTYLAKFEDADTKPEELTRAGTMKIVDISEEGITFDNGSALRHFHFQDCCENVYADWKSMQVVTKISANQLNAQELDFDKNILSKISKVNDIGFIIESEQGIKLFVSCYNQQNGCYSSNLSLIYANGSVTYGELNISDCVKDEIW